jgi:hypothetical protein
MAVLRALVAEDEALAERSAAVLVPITVMIFPFRSSGRCHQTLAASKGDNGGVSQAFSAGHHFFEKYPIASLLRARVRQKPGNLPVPAEKNCRSAASGNRH